MTFEICFALVWKSGQRPVKFGARFSTNAVMPSFASWLEKSSPKASASASRFSTWSPWSAWLIAAFAAAIASGPFDAISCATSSVFSSSSPGSKTPLTRPIRSASSASTTAR